MFKGNSLPLNFFIGDNHPFAANKPLHLLNALRKEGVCQFYLLALQWTWEYIFVHLQAA